MEADSVRQSKGNQVAKENGIAGKPDAALNEKDAFDRSAERVVAAAAGTSVGRWRGWMPGRVTGKERGTAVRVAAALLGGLGLRLWMMGAFPQDGGDALIYGDLAKNILLHGRFAITDGSGAIHSTLIRLPGYPLFLAGCFQVFGVENYHAVAYLQMTLELAACLLLADFTRRIANPRAGLNALWLAAMCPFTAVYASAPLTESLTLDMICLALWSLERYLSRRRWHWLGLFMLAISYAALLRPDGALLAFALWPALVFSRGVDVRSGAALRPAILCGLVSVLPFGVWSWRNWTTFHVIEPLAPRYAGDPGEDPHLGWQHWVKTWCLDFTCTSDIYWNVPDGAITVDALPERAFDSAEQKADTTAMFAEYMQGQEISPALDARFEVLARQRTASHPWRSWVWLPVGRLGDMLLRPRVENLTIELRWWEFWRHRDETVFSYVYGALNLALLGLGLRGLLMKPRLWAYMTVYFALRSLLLMTIEAPETRYTLEFFPMVFALAGIAMERMLRRGSRRLVIDDLGAGGGLDFKGV